MRSPTPPPPRLKGWPVTDRFSAGAATCDSIPALSGLRCVELETSTSMVNARLNGERQCRSGRQRPEGSRPLIKRLAPGPLGAFDLAPRFNSCRGYGRGSAWRCAPFRAPRILLIVIGRRSAASSASPSRVRETEFCGLRLAGDFGHKTENGRNSVRRPRHASLTDRNYEGFCRPGNRVGLPGLQVGDAGIEPATPSCAVTAIEPPTMSVTEAFRHHVRGANPFRFPGKPPIVRIATNQL